MTSRPRQRTVLTEATAVDVATAEVVLEDYRSIENHVVQTKGMCAYRELGGSLRRCRCRLRGDLHWRRGSLHWRRRLDVGGNLDFRRRLHLGCLDGLAALNGGGLLTLITIRELRIGPVRR